MKVVAIGFGQCGSNIADEFYAINDHAKSWLDRRIEILTDAFAVNTDETDLGGIAHIPTDKHHRILIGAQRTSGHGVGKINTEAARIVREAHSVITDNIMRSRNFHEADGIVAIAGAAGGTGSGSIGWVIKKLKERTEKPVYAILVLPFAYEENGLSSYAVTNSATCVKTVIQYADAVFLLDNERFARRDTSLAHNLREINRAMVTNFYDLFCAGEEKRRQYVGSKVVDAGDVRQSLDGITAIAREKISLGSFYHRLRNNFRGNNFREGAKEKSALVGALGQAMNGLSLGIDIQDAGKILVLVTAPKDVITLTALEDTNTFLLERAPKAIVRMGDYPRRGNEVSVTLIASKITKVPTVENLYLQARDIFDKQGEISLEADVKIKQIYDTSKGIPTLA